MIPLCFDNDVVSKLASCDLIDLAMLALDADHSVVSILSTLKHRFGITDSKRRLKIEMQIGASAFSRIAEFHSRVSELPAVNPDLLSPFDDLQAIDVGEALLFAFGAATPELLVVTGDKRSLRCLGSNEKCKEVAAMLTGRVMCFEQLIKLIIEKCGFDEVKRRVVPAVECDSGLRAAFGSGLDAEEHQVIRVLDSYIEEMRNATGTLLR